MARTLRLFYTSLLHLMVMGARSPFWVMECCGVSGWGLLGLGIAV